MERLTGSREDAGFVERFGDTGFGVVIEEAVDLGDDGRRRAPGFGRGQPNGDVEAVGLAAAEADMHGDVVIADDVTADNKDEE